MASYLYTPSGELKRFWWRERAVAAPIRVFLTDDHRVVRRAVARALQDAPDIVVIGEAADGLEAVSRVPSVCPDVVLMDITMPGLNGIEATRCIRNKCPDVKVIGLSMHDGPTMAEAMRAAGAVDYVAKGCDPSTLIAVIRRVGAARRERSGPSGGDKPESPDGQLACAG